MAELVHLEKSQYWLDYLTEISRQHDSMELLDTAVDENEQVVQRPPSERLYIKQHFSSSYIDPQNPDTKTERYELEELFRQAKRFFILGDPGSGKTSLIKRISYLLSEGRQLREAYGQLLPFPIILRDLNYQEVNSWEELLRAFFEQSLPPEKISYKAKEIQAVFESGQAFVLLDGLDEITEPQTRKKLARLILEGIQAHPDCRWWITSRIVGFDQANFWGRKTSDKAQDAELEISAETNLISPLTIGRRSRQKEKTGKHTSKDQPFKEIYLAPFDDIQINLFLKNWAEYFRLPEGKEQFAEDFKNNLFRHPHIQHLARIPNMLAMMCLYYKVNKNFPDGRYLLYKKIAEIYLQKLFERRGIEKAPLTLDEQKNCLATIALHMQQQRAKSADKQLVITEKEAKELCLETLRQQPSAQSGERLQERIDAYFRRLQLGSAVFIPRARGIYGFLHLSYQEYFAAEALKSQFREACSRWAKPEKEERFWEKARKYAQDLSSWGESLTLFFQSLMVKGEQDIRACRYALEKLIGWKPKQNPPLDTNFIELTELLLTDESICSSDWDAENRTAPLLTKEEQLELLDSIVQEYITPPPPLVRAQYFIHPEHIHHKKSLEWIYHKKSQTTANKFITWAKEKGFWFKGKIKNLNLTQQKKIKPLWVVLENTKVDNNALHSLNKKKIFQKCRILHLSNNQITDTKALSQLTELRSLRLSHNKITDISGLKNMTKLTELHLYDNQITDTKALSQLTELQNLRLSHNKISNISGLKNMTKLRVLLLEKNEIIDIKHLRELEKLILLNISRNKIVDISPLRNAKELIALLASYNRINKIPDFCHLNKLEILIIKNNRISSLDNLKSAKNLKSLIIDRNNISTVSNIEKLTKLEKLSLSGNKITIIPKLKALNKLKALWMNNNKITNIENLKHVNKLSFISLNNNKISDITSLKKIRGVRALQLSNNEISDISPLEKLFKIKSLHLSSNNIKEISALSNLRKIKYLSLSNNKITSINPLKELTQIMTLKVSANQISDISALIHLKRIKRLYLSENRIINISVIKNLAKITHLKLSNNKISDITPLQNLKNLEVLELMDTEVKDTSPIKKLSIKVLRI